MNYTDYILMESKINSYLEKNSDLVQIGEGMKFKDEFLSRYKAIGINVCSESKCDVLSPEQVKKLFEFYNFLSNVEVKKEDLNFEDIETIKLMLKNVQEVSKRNDLQMPAETIISQVDEYRGWGDEHLDEVSYWFNHYLSNYSYELIVKIAVTLNTEDFIKSVSELINVDGIFEHYNHYNEALVLKCENTYNLLLFKLNNNESLSDVETSLLKTFCESYIAEADYNMGKMYDEMDKYDLEYSEEQELWAEIDECKETIKEYEKILEKLESSEKGKDNQSRE